MGWGKLSLVRRGSLYEILGEMGRLLCFDNATCRVVSAFWCFWEAESGSFCPSLPIANLGISISI